MFGNNRNEVYIFFTTQDYKSKQARLNLLKYYKIKSALSGGKVFPNLFQDSITQDMLTSLSVYAFHNSFFIKNDKNIWVIQYKFGTYSRSDAVTNLNDIFKMVVIEREKNLFLCTFGKQEIELC